MKLNRTGKILQAERDALVGAYIRITQEQEIYAVFVAKDANFRMPTDVFRFRTLDEVVNLADNIWTVWWLDRSTPKLSRAEIVKIVVKCAIFLLMGATVIWGQGFFQFDRNIPGIGPTLNLLFHLAMAVIYVDIKWEEIKHPRIWVLIAIAVICLIILSDVFSLVTQLQRNIA